jgi:uncharacterized protein
MKKLILFVSLVLVLVASACTAPVQSPAQQQNQPGSTTPRSINVAGTGQVSLAPDVAYVYIGVQSQSENVAQALSDNNAKAQAISTALVELGVAEADIQTSSFNIYPQQQYSPMGEITGTTYNVDNSVYVTVRDLSVLGRLLDTVVRSGANSINGINFDVLNKDQAIGEARRLAIESARVQAEALAQAAGVTLGEVLNINAYTTGAPVPMSDNKGGFAADASQVPLSAGQVVVRVEVNVGYAIR